MSVIGKLLHILSLVVYRSPRSIRLRRAGFPLPCPVFLVNLVLNLNSPRSSLGIEFNETQNLFLSTARKYIFGVYSSITIAGADLLVLCVLSLH